MASVAGLPTQGPHERTFERLFGENKMPARTSTRPGLTRHFSSKKGNFGWSTTGESLADCGAVDDKAAGASRGKKSTPAHDSALVGHFVEPREDQREPSVLVEKEMKAMIGKARAHVEAPIGRDGGHMSDLVSPPIASPRRARASPSREADIPQSPQPIGSLLRGSVGVRPLPRGAQDNVVLADTPMESRSNMPSELKRKVVALDPKFKIDRYNTIRCFPDCEKNRSCAALTFDLPGARCSSEVVLRGVLGRSGDDTGSRRIAPPRKDRITQIFQGI